MQKPSYTGGKTYITVQAGCVLAYRDCIDISQYIYLGFFLEGLRLKNIDVYQTFC